MNAGTGELKLLKQNTIRLTSELLRKTTREINRVSYPDQSNAPEQECKDGVCVLNWKPRRPAA